MTVTEDRRVIEKFLVLFVLIGGLTWGFREWISPPFPRSGKVVMVFDGDTVQLDSGAKVRYLGVDAPEVDHESGGLNSQCFGNEAWRINRRWVLGKIVRLEYETPFLDPYGRLLAYVYTKDGRFINLDLLLQGYAYVYRTPAGFSKLKEFLEAQRSAIHHKRGMWSACHVRPEPYYLGNCRNYVFHRPGCPFGRRIYARNRVVFKSRWDAFEAGYRPCRRCNP